MKTYLLLISFLLSLSISAQRFEWLEIYSSTSFSNFDQIVEVFDNNVIVAGEFQGNISFGSTVLNAGTSRNIYVANFDTLGNFRWAIKGGSSTNFSDIRDIDLDRFGNIYILGTYSNTISWGNLTINTSGTSSFSSEGFLVKLNNQGASQWIEGIYSPSNSLPFNSLTEISVIDNSVYFGGTLSRTIAVTGSSLTLVQSTSPFLNNIYVGKFDLSGTLLDLDKIGNTNGSSSLSIGDIEAISDSSFILSSTIRGAYSFGSNNRSINLVTSSLVLAKFTNGSCSWLSNSTSSSNSFSNRPPQLEIAPNGNVFVAASFASNLQIQSKSISANGPSAFSSYWYGAIFDANGAILELGNLNVAGSNVYDVEINSKNEYFIIGGFVDSLDFNGKKTFTNGNSDILILNLDSALRVNWYQTGGGGNADNGLSIATSNSTNVYALGTFRGLSQFGTTFFSGNASFSTSVLMKLGECGKTPVSLTFNGDTNLCAGQSVRIQANPTSFATFQWLKDSSQLTGEVFRDLIIDSTGNYQVIVNGQGCLDTSRVVRVNVGTPPTVVYSTNDTVCEQDAPIILTGGTPAGGTYKGAGVTNNVFDPSVNGIGNTQITYVFSNGGCSDSANSSIFVKPAPTVFFAPIANVCITSPSILLTNAFPLGGVFSGNGVSGNQFDPVLAGGGIHLITYTYTDGSGCFSSATQTVEVDTLPNTSFSAIPSLCVNHGKYALSEGAPAGGTYSGPGVVNGEFDPSISGVGTFTINYVLSNQCGSSTSTQTITVNPSPTVSLASFPDVCEGSGLVTLSGGTPAGGTYSGVGVSGGQFSPITAGVGTFKIYYDYTDVLGCSSVDSSTIRVNGLPMATITPNNSICNGSSTSLTATGGTTYLWSTTETTASISVSPITTTQYFVTITNASNCSVVEDVTVTVNANPIASISGTTTICEGSNTALTASGGVSYVWNTTATTATITESPMVNITYTVTVTDVNGCSDVESQLVTVNPSPTVSLAPFSDVCEGSGLITLSGGTPTGGIYSGVGVSGGQFNPITAGIGTFKIYYNYTDGLGCSSVDSSTITVNALPITTISPNTAICNGTGVILNASGGTSYLWSTSATTPTIMEMPTVTTQYFVTITNASNCSVVEDVIVTVNQRPIASISGTTTICEGSSTTLSASGGNTSVWSTFTFGTSITVSPLVSTTYTVTVTDGNGCTGVASQLVRVNPSPTVSLASFPDVCEGSGLVTLSGGTPAGGTYSGVGVSAGQFDPVVAGVGIFKIYYDYTDGLGCSSVDSSTITVNGSPTVTITSNSFICNGSSTTLTAAGGTTYLWSTTETTATISVSPTITTQYFVTVTNASNCSTVISVPVTVNPNPIASINGVTTICEGNSTALTAIGGVSYIWNTTATTATITESPIVNTTYTVTVTDVNGCSDVASQLVTVNPSPTVSLAPFSDVCEGSGLVTLSGGSPAGGTYSGVGVSAGQFDPTIAGIGTFKIYYDFTDGLGCSSVDSSIITVNGLPTATITPNSSICEGSSTILTATGGSTYIWSTTATTTSINVSPTITTQYFVTISNASNCSVVEDVTVTVNANPQLLASNDTSLCLGDTISISASSDFSNYQWNTTETTPTIRVFPTNSTFYTVRSTNGNCISEDTVFVVVNTGTSINIGPDTTLDPVTTTSYTYDAGAGFTSYLWQDNTTNQTLTVNYDPAKAGITEAISVIVGNSSGCPSVDTAFVFYDFNISIGENKDIESGIRIMPNPTTEIVNIHFNMKSSSDRRVRIFDLRGKLVFDNVYSNQEEIIRIDIIDTKMNKGVYLLNIEIDGENYQEKIVVQ